MSSSPGFTPAPRVPGVASLHYKRHLPAEARRYMAGQRVHLWIAACCIERGLPLLT